MKNKTISLKLNSQFALFLGRKIIFLFLTFFVGMNLLFILPRLLPYSPIDIMIGRVMGSGGTSVSGQRSVGGVEATSLEVMRRVYEEKFGLTQPLQVQYMLFWKRIFTLDFGVSYWRYPYSIQSLILYALPWTLALMIPVVPLGFFLGNWIGSRAAFSKSKFSNLLLIISNYMFQAPYYWFGLILMYIFGVYLKWFPLYGAYSSRWIRPVLSLEWFLDASWHYVLPFLSLLGSGVGGWAIDMRALILYEMQTDYIQYCRTLGFRESKLRRYAQRNAILPNFTWLPISFSSLISQTLLVEIVFGYPGLGSLMFNAVFAVDYPLIEATFLFSILIILIGNFVCDILYGIIDPRIGSGYMEAK